MQCGGGRISPSERESQLNVGYVSEVKLAIKGAGDQQRHWGKHMKAVA